MAHRLALHPGQKQVFFDPHRFKVIVAGRRWGKSWLSLISIVRAAARPRQNIWYVAPTYGQARDVMWDALKDAFPIHMLAGPPNETRMSIRLINGTKITLKGADKPDTLRGSTVHFLVIDEAQNIKADAWYKVLRPTLATTGGHVLFIGTPNQFNWFYDIYMLGQRGDTYLGKDGLRRRNKYKSWRFPTRDSPFVSAAEIEEARANLDEKSFRQEWEASFETMAGRVYYAFERNTHVKELVFNPRLPIWIGQDFNIDPMSSVVMQYQPNGELWIIDEVILFGSNTQETADELARRYYRFMKQVVLYPDPAGRNRTTASRGESDLDILRDAGFRRIKARRKHPPVSDRVNAVNRMFKAADGRVRLYVDPRCKHTINAFEQTIYKEGSREVDKSLGVEHPADAVGYCVWEEFPIRKIRPVGLSF